MGTEKIGHAISRDLQFRLGLLGELEQTQHFAGLHIQINIVEGWACGQAGHGAHITKDRVQEASTNTGTNLADGDAEARRSAFLGGICGEG